MNNTKFMKMAIQLSMDSIENEGGPFGCVITKDGEIIASASNSVTKDKDPTAHAEVNAIRLAAKNLKTNDLSGCEIYSSCEPCPMCMAAIYWARINKLYFANTRQDAENIGFSDKFIYEELCKDYELRTIEIKPLMREEAIKAFQKWEDFEKKIKY